LIDHHHADRRILQIEKPAPEQRLRDRAMITPEMFGLYGLVEVTLRGKAVCHTAAGHADMTAQRAQRIDAAEDLCAVPIFVQAPAEQYGGWLGGRIGACKCADPVRRQFACAAKLIQRPPVKKCSVLVETMRTLRDKSAIFAAFFEHDLRHGQSQFGITRHFRLDVLVAEAGRFRPYGIDQDDLAAAGRNLLEERHQVKISGERIAAPQQYQTAVEDVDWVVPDARTEVERLPSTRGAAAQRSAGDGDPASQIPEAAAQELAGAP
jgi:hypothetical protein